METPPVSSNSSHPRSVDVCPQPPAAVAIVYKTASSPKSVYPRTAHIHPRKSTTIPRTFEQPPRSAMVILCPPDIHRGVASQISIDNRQSSRARVLAL